MPVAGASRLPQPLVSARIIGIGVGQVRATVADGRVASGRRRSVSFSREIPRTCVDQAMLAGLLFCTAVFLFAIAVGQDTPRPGRRRRFAVP